MRRHVTLWGTKTTTGYKDALAMKPLVFSKSKSQGGGAQTLRGARREIEDIERVKPYRGRLVRPGRVLRPTGQPRRSRYVLWPVSCVPRPVGAVWVHAHGIRSGRSFPLWQNAQPRTGRTVGPATSHCIPSRYTGTRHGSTFLVRPDDSS